MRHLLVVLAMGLLASGCATYQEAYAPKPPAETPSQAVALADGSTAAGQARIHC